MSLIQDLVVIYSMEARHYTDEDGISRVVSTKIIHAQWFMPSGGEVDFPAWVRHGIETKGWDYEVQEGSHIVLDYDKTGQDREDIFRMIEGAPDFTPE